MRVLIAEDDTVSRTILRRAVEKLGHECLAASDGDEAWRLYEETPDLDVIISDWMMPGMDGVELCRRVRNSEKNGYTHFIFLTALGDRGHLLTGLQAGADDYLSKPLDRDELQVRLISASRITTLHRKLERQNAELARLKDKFFEQARRDPLTDLGNRLQLREDLEMLKGRAERYGHTYCAALCDIDFFKLYNDHYGHPAGDKILVRVASTLKDGCRKGDALYRYGGEEFLVILPGQTLESATTVADRLRKDVEALKIPHEAKNLPGVVTISAGVAELSAEHPKTSDELLKEADTALYRAKQAGRNRVTRYDGKAD